MKSVHVEKHLTMLYMRPGSSSPQNVNRHHSTFQVLSQDEPKSPGQGKASPPLLLVSVGLV